MRVPDSNPPATGQPPQLTAPYIVVTRDCPINVVTGDYLGEQEWGRKETLGYLIIVCLPNDDSDRLRSRYSGSLLRPHEGSMKTCKNDVLMLDSARLRRSGRRHVEVSR